MLKILPIIPFKIPKNSLITLFYFCISPIIPTIMLILVSLNNLDALFEYLNILIVLEAFQFLSTGTHVLNITFFVHSLTLSSS